MKSMRLSLSFILLNAIVFVLGFSLLKYAPHYSRAAINPSPQTGDSLQVPNASTVIHGGKTVSTEELRVLAQHSLARLQEQAKQRVKVSEHEEEEHEAEHGPNNSSMKQVFPAPLNLTVSRSEAQLVAQQLPQSPEPITKWNALGGAEGGGYPPDTQISASRTHVLVTANGVLGFYDKAGKQLQVIGTGEFFSPLNLDTELKKLNSQFVDADGIGYFDLRTIYDPYRRRFWVGALAYNHAATKASDKDANGKCLFAPERRRRLTKFAVGVSRTENPLDGWYLYWWDAVAGDGSAFLGNAQRGNRAGYAGDYPYLSVDQKYVYQYNWIGDNYDCATRSNHLIFFPADALAQGVAGLPAGHEFWDIPAATDANGKIDPVFQLAPAIHQDDSSSRTFFAAAYGSNQILVYALSNHLTANQKLDRSTVALSANYNGAPEGPQKDSCVNLAYSNGGNSVMKSVYRDGFLTLTMQDAENWFGDGQLQTSIRLVRLPVSTYPTISPGQITDRRFGKNSSTDDAANARMYYGWPAHDVNAQNEVAIVYARTGNTIYPEARYSLYRFGAGETDIRPSRVIKLGESFYDSGAKSLNCPVPSGGATPTTRWGDNAGASVDPFDDTAIWLAQAYATSNNNFKIAVGKVLGTAHPDLIVEKAVTAGLHFKPGQSFSLTTSIRNQGDGPTSGQVAISYRLSKDPSISVLNDPEIGTETRPALPAGQDSVVSKTVTLPDNLEPGAYYIGVTIISQTSEYSATNNIGRSARPIIVRAADANTFLPAPGTRWHESFGFAGEIPASGDFNGDGKDDVCVFNKTDGAVYVALSDGAKFNGNGAAARWTSGFSQGNEVPLVGDFNGDGKDDIVTLVQNTKTDTQAAEVYVALSTGTRFGLKTKWHDKFSQSNDQIAIGDFNGDGKDDLLAVVSNGQVYVALSDGARFGASIIWFSFGTLGTAPRIVGDFNGDGLADLATFSLNLGDMDVLISSGSNFLNRPTWAGNFANGAELPLVGDFNGDGKDDGIVFTRGSSSDVFVALSNGTKLLEPREKWHDLFAVGTETPIIGDFNGDGADDIATFTLSSSADIFVSLAKRKLLGIVSAASFSTTGFAPDSIVAGFGLNLATGTQAANTTPLPTTLLGTKVTVTDKNNVARLAPLFFVSPGQINFLIPSGTAIGAATIKIEDGAGFVSADTFDIERLAPGLFTANANGQDVPAAIIVRVRNGVQTFEPVATFDQRTGRFVAVPIDLGPPTDQVILVLFGTGLRSNAGGSTVTCRLNRITQPVLFAGAQGSLVGLDQVNLLLPRTLGGQGEVTLDLVIENSISNSVKINIK
jgi:uncharacterized protein (TIGR03437 family)